MPQRTLTACADPNNLPFSNKAGQGFENKLAQMIAGDLHAQARLYLVGAAPRLCPQHAERAQMRLLARHRQQCRNGRDHPTLLSLDLHVRDPCQRASSGLTLDDPRLKTLRIGVQMVGDDASNTPPAHALARRGIVGNVRGYMLYGDYAAPNPPAEIMRAVERGEVDVALVWGPLAGYFAARSEVPVRLEPVTPWFADNQWPMQFDVSVGVQKDNQKLLKDIDRVLVRRSADIAKLLAAYRVPVVKQ